MRVIVVSLFLARSSLSFVVIAQNPEALASGFCLSSAGTFCFQKSLSWLIDPILALGWMVIARVEKNVLCNDLSMKKKGPRESVVALSFEVHGGVSILIYTVISGTVLGFFGGLSLEELSASEMSSMISNSLLSS